MGFSLFFHDVLQQNLERTYEPYLYEKNQSNAGGEEEDGIKGRKAMKKTLVTLNNKINKYLCNSWEKMSSPLRVLLE